MNNFTHKKKYFWLRFLGEKYFFGIFLVLETVKSADFWLFWTEHKGPPLSFFSGEKSDPQNFHIVIVLAKVCFLGTENHGISKDFKIFSPR